MKSLLFLLSFFLLSCEGLFPVIFGAGVPSYVPPPRSPLAPSAPLEPIRPLEESEWGVVKCSETTDTTRRETLTYLNKFNARLREFLSTSINPLNFEHWHACTKSRSGGVYFRGKIITTERMNTNNPNQNLEILKEGSYIEIHFEHFKPLNKQKFAPISMKFSYGNIQGQEAFLTFEDEKGSVSLDGRIQNINGKILFTGFFKYNNFQKWDGGPGYSGTLGSISIAACKFFQC